MTARTGSSVPPAPGRPTSPSTGGSRPRATSPSRRALQRRARTWRSTRTTARCARRRFRARVHPAARRARERHPDAEQSRWPRGSDLLRRGEPASARSLAGVAGAGRALRPLRASGLRRRLRATSHGAPSATRPASSSLVLMDVLPWDSDAIQQVLDANGIPYYGAGSADLPSLDLSTSDDLHRQRPASVLL